MIHRLLDTDLNWQQKGSHRLHTEILGGIIAGTEGTANVLVTATFHLLCNTQYSSRLQSELNSIWPMNGYPDFEVLFKLPCLVMYLPNSHLI
jgi:cytochrome P450